jgi:hypothetical protein
MKPQLYEEDTLIHIEYSGDVIQVDDPSLLRNQVSSTEGQIVIVAAFGCSLVLEYSFGAINLKVRVVLKTPVGNVTIISVHLDPEHPSIKLGGSIDGFKAEAAVSFNFSNFELAATGEVCAPVLGCKRGSAHVKV